MTGVNDATNPNLSQATPGLTDRKVWGVGRTTFQDPMIGDATNAGISTMPAAQNAIAAMFPVGNDTSIIS